MTFVAVATLVLAGCTQPEPAPTLPAQLRAEGVARLVPSPDAPVAALAAGIGAFGHALGTPVKGDTNWVVSPASIAYAFAMARAGANGPTAAEIDQVFGFPTPGVHEALNSFTRDAVTAETPPARKADATRTAGPPAPPIFCVGNAIFAQSGLPVGQEFLKTLAQQYGAGVFPVDFASPSAQQTIDQWVRVQTAQRIQKLFDNLPAQTRLVLANAVYLKADWKYAFAEYPTTDAPFHRADGSDVTVALMQQKQSLRYAAGAGWQAVELPLAGGELVMWILVPATAGPEPHQLLSPASLAAVRAGLAEQRVEVLLPKFDFATDLDLKADLQRLGIHHAFADADFSGIYPGLYIDQAVHRANITVDEWGVEAAAVTGLGFPVSAPPEPTATVRADHPFAFAIMHAPTGVPLFIGHVADPTAS